MAERMPPGPLHVGLHLPHPLLLEGAGKERVGHGDDAAVGRVAPGLHRPLQGVRDVVRVRRRPGLVYAQVHAEDNERLVVEPEDGADVLLHRLPVGLLRLVEVPRVGHEEDAASRRTSSVAMSW
jgi:hypothetical protein